MLRSLWLAKLHKLVASDQKVSLTTYDLSETMRIDIQSNKYVSCQTSGKNTNMAYII